MKFKLSKFTTAVAVSAAITLAAFGANAAGNHGHGHGGNIGKAGDPNKVTRTINVTMHDNYYEPENITICLTSSTMGHIEVFS